MVESRRIAEKLPYPTSRLNDGARRAILFDSTKCIGCRQCVQACKDWNDLPRGNSFKISRSTWITMEPPVLEGMSAVWGRNSCMHCEYPVCAAVCPTEAIIKHQEGPVVIDQGKCIGCSYCVYACPWGVISQDQVTKKAAKCTMCHDRVGNDSKPFCVQICPVDALDFGPMGAIKSKAESRAAEAGGHIYGHEEAGGAQVLHVLKEPVWDHGLPRVGPEKYPHPRIPLGVKVKGLLTLTGGLSGKLRAIKSALVHPGRLKYRYWPGR